MSIFPNQLKIAKVVPILKSGDDTLFTNYRPVSLLPSTSKVVEKLFLINYIPILKQINFSMEVNMGFVNVTQPNLSH